MSCPRVQGQPARANSSPGARAFLSWGVSYTDWDASSFTYCHSHSWYVKKGSDQGLWNRRLHNCISVFVIVLLLGGLGLFKDAQGYSLLLCCYDKHQYHKLLGEKSWFGLQLIGYCHHWGGSRKLEAETEDYKENYKEKGIAASCLSPLGLLNRFLYTIQDHLPTNDTIPSWIGPPTNDTITSGIGPCTPISN